MKPISSKISRIITSLEGNKTSIYYFLLAFVCIAFIRSFIEAILMEGKFLTLTDIIFHYPLFFATLLMGFSIIFAGLISKEITISFKVLIPSFLIILLPPLIDLIVFGVYQYRLTYVYIDHINELFRDFYLFFRTCINIKWRCYSGYPDWNCCGFSWYSSLFISLHKVLDPDHSCYICFLLSHFSFTSHSVY